MVEPTSILPANDLIFLNFSHGESLEALFFGHLNESCSLKTFKYLSRLCRKRSFLATRLLILELLLMSENNWVSTDQIQMDPNFSLLKVKGILFS